MSNSTELREPQQHLPSSGCRVAAPGPRAPLSAINNTLPPYVAMRSGLIVAHLQNDAMGRNPKSKALFDDIVSEREQVGRNIKIKSFCGFQIHHKLEPGRLFNG
jgi:hypothetical protein